MEAGGACNHKPCPGFHMSLARIHHDLPPISIAPSTTTFIKPAKKTDPLHWITLSNFDHLFPDFYSPVIFYYPYQQGRCSAWGDKVDVEKLKESLSETLVEFFPLAGRVVQNENEIAKLHCNDAGVVFTEAYVGAAMEDLKAEEVGGYHPAPQLSGMTAAGLVGESRAFSAKGDGIPALVIQVTDFSCGGFSVALNWNHRVADGFAGSQFIKAWTNICRGKPISPLPVHDRSLLKPRNPPQINVDITDTVSIVHAGPPPRPSAKDPQQMIMAKFESAFVEQLKVEASKGGTGPFTALDCLCAHLWRVRTVLLGLTGNQEVQFMTHVDGRRKLSPPPPPGYFSNVVVVTYSAMPADRLLSEPLSSVVGIIRGAIQQVDDETLRSTVDWVELQGKTNVSLFGPQVDFRHGLCVSSWASFPLYEMDFGWGAPAFVVRNSLNYPDLSAVYIFPAPPSQGKFIALLHLPQSLAMQLLSNPSLLTRLYM